MDSGRYKTGNVAMTFIIGFVAGTTPFVFMKLLPMMLHPELYAVETRHLVIMLAGVIMTGCIIGVITSLIFAGEFEQKDPKEIFVYALGIPAILISTVSGLMTDFNAVQRIATVQTSASAAILSSTPAPQEIPEVITDPVEGSSTTDHGSGLLLGTAWAGEARPYQVAANGSWEYIVVIGTYTDEREAKDMLEKFQHRKFKTEAYVRKRLELRRVDGKPIQYLILYNRFAQQADAQRAYGLLSINDPDLNLGLMKMSTQ